MWQSYQYSVNNEYTNRINSASVIIEIHPALAILPLSVCLTPPMLLSHYLSLSLF